MAVETWNGYTARTNILTIQLDSLANNTISSASVVIDNSANLDTVMVLELILASLTPAAGNYISIYLQQAPDGTNYEDVPLTAGAHGSGPIETFRFSTSASAKRKVSQGFIAIPPGKFKLFLDNKTGVALGATGNILNAYTTNLKIV